MAGPNLRDLAPGQTQMRRSGGEPFGDTVFDLTSPRDEFAALITMCLTTERTGWLCSIYTYFFK